MKSIKEANLAAETRVLVRCDLDVPLDNGLIKDTFRVDRALSTLKFVLENGAFPVICGHLGRPDGKTDESLSTKHLKNYFDEKLGEGNFEILENLRFTPGEKDNSEDFSKELASKGQIYVNEAFGNSHRSHASMIGVSKILPAYAGLNLMQEVSVLEKVLKNPERPLVAIVGGAKIETKQPVLSKFSEISDEVLVGGRIGLETGGSSHKHVHLPIDYANQNFDIGLKTIALFEKKIESAKTIVWAGPMGKFEDSEYVQGTKRIAEAIVASSAYSVVGGGDTISALSLFNLLDKVSFVSTGGGAMLEFLVKGNLPALEVLGYHD